MRPSVRAGLCLLSFTFIKGFDPCFELRRSRDVKLWSAVSPLIFRNFKELDSLLSSKCLVYDCIKAFSSGYILDFVPQLRCGRKWL